MRRDSAGSSPACGWSSCAVVDHFPDGSNMVGQQRALNARVDPLLATGYRSAHIRPVAVRPLDHPERWPTPRGFLFSGLESDGFRRVGRSEP